MIAIAGNATLLYCIGLNSGVWRSVNGGPWQQLTRSPTAACCVVVDPNDPNHLYVGTRLGLASPTTLNDGGLWESPDSGDTWNYVLNPLQYFHGQSGFDPCQSVPSLCFTKSGALLVATRYGVIRRNAKTMIFENVVPVIKGEGLVTAVAASSKGNQSIAWARTGGLAGTSAGTLFYSLLDGDLGTWASVDMGLEKPFIVNGFAIEFDDSNPTQGGDRYSLAAYESTAYMPFSYNNKDSTKAAVKSIAVGDGNHNSVLYYDLSGAQWSTQVIGFSNSGQGAGGRRLVKTFAVNGRAQLFYCGGSDILHADPQHVDKDGNPTWSTWAHWAAQHIHNDFHDFHMLSDGTLSWIACDGGVFEGAHAQQYWKQRNAGLHTHHIYQLVAVRDKTQTSVAYCTADNDSWCRDTIWHGMRTYGDTNFVAADEGCPAVFLSCRSPMQGTLSAFNGKGVQVHISWDAFDKVFNQEGVDAVTAQSLPFIQFIQSPVGEEAEAPLLDAIVVVCPPLRWSPTGDVLKPHLQPVKSGWGMINLNPYKEFIILRNRAFQLASDCDIHQFSNPPWEKVDLQPPPFCNGVVAAGGHKNPVFYAYTNSSSGGKRVGNIFRLGPKGGGIGWIQLLEQPELLLHTVADGASYPPVFVNPYRASEVYLVTQSGVKFSEDFGQTFKPDEALTALVTDSGLYPFRETHGEAQNLDGSGTETAAWPATRANLLKPLAHMTFNRLNPDEAFACSAFTGVFFRGKDFVWRNLTEYRISPRSAMSAVACDGKSVFFATQGRGIFRVDGYRDARIATFYLFNVDESEFTLVDSRFQILPDAKVWMTARPVGRTQFMTWVVVTDKAGKASLAHPTLLLDGKYVLTIEFPGDDDHAMGRTRRLMEFQRQVVTDQRPLSYPALAEPSLPIRRSR